MNIRYIGDPNFVHPSGGTAVFRFFNNDNELFAVVHNNHLESFSVSSTITGASRYEIMLKCEPGDDLSGIPEAAVVEMFVGDAKSPLHPMRRLLAGIIDYYEMSSERDPEGKSLLRLEGRSVWGRLIDRPVRGSIGGPAREVFRALSSNLLSVFERPELEEIIDASFNCPSAYGGMRLLALSLGCVVANENDELSVDTVQGARARLEAEPVMTLTDKDILNSGFRRGTPVRKRQEEV